MRRSKKAHCMPSEDPFVVMCQRYPSQVFIHTHSLNYFTAFMLWEIDTVGMKTNLKQLLEYFFYITPYIVSAWVTSRTDGGISSFITTFAGMWPRTRPPMR